MARTTRTTKSSKTDRIDFGGVPEEIRKRGRHIPEGDYAFKIVDHKKKWKDDDKSNPPYYSWRMQVIEGKHKGTPFYYVTSLKPDALFNLRNLIFAASDGKKNVAGKRLDFDPKSLYGKKIAGLVEDEEYDEKIRSRLVDVRPYSELEESDEDEDEDEEDEDDEDEDDDEEEDEDEDEDEEEEDEDEDDEDDEDDEPPVKKKKKKKQADDDDLDEVDVDEI